MKKQIFYSLILLTLFFVSDASSQDCKEFQKLVDDTYNFKPSKISENERNVKSEKMDAVWNKVKGNRQNLLPCLRDEIKTRTKDTFFRFDASNLLISLDQSNESKNTLIKSYAEVDLDDVNRGYWMQYMAILGYEGFDTSAAGENWLNHPDPKYFLPQHGTLAVNKEIGALIIYGSMDEIIATPALVKVAFQEKHPAKEIAVGLLLQQSTTESFKELKKINSENLSESLKQTINVFLSKQTLLSAREGTPKTTRAQYLDAFSQLTQGKPQAFLKLAVEITDGEKDVIAVLKQEDIPLVRKARRYFAATANPHSAEWYKSFTDVLKTMVLNSELQNKNNPKK